MASAMSLMKNMELSSGHVGLVGVALDTGVGFGASYALGRAYHAYGDKWYGKQAPRLAAIVGKVGAIAAAMMGHAPGIVAGTLNSVGQAGVNAIGLELGLRHARKSSGKKAVLVPAGTDIKKIAGATEVTTMGALGKAAPGRGLSWDQIEELAASH